MSFRLTPICLNRIFEILVIYARGEFIKARQLEEWPSFMNFSYKRFCFQTGLLTPPPLPLRLCEGGGAGGKTWFLALWEKRFVGRVKCNWKKGFSGAWGLRSQELRAGAKGAWGVRRAGRWGQTGFTFNSKLQPGYSVTSKTKNYLGAIHILRHIKIEDFDPPSYCVIFR